METQHKLNHDANTISEALSIDQEKLDYITNLLGQKEREMKENGNSTTSQILSTVVEVCKDPIEIAYIAFKLGSIKTKHDIEMDMKLAQLNGLLHLFNKLTDEE